MNLNKLAKLICEREGKRKQTDIAQVKEILKCLIIICAEDVSVFDLIVTSTYKKVAKGVK